MPTEPTSPYVQATRQLQRPWVVVAVWLILGYCVVTGTDIPGELWGIAGLITGHLFGERGVRHGAGIRTTEDEKEPV